MFSSFQQKSGFGIQVVLEPIPAARSRLWVCTACGSKIYQGKATTAPRYSCLCGQQQWKPVKSLMGLVP
ncbi:MAG: hypothetical protein ABFC57_12050 [Veillonellales bacterium]